MRTHVLPALALVVLVVFGAALCGCSDTSAPRNILRVTEINENQPLESDVARGSDAVITVREDAVVVAIQSTPHDGALDLSAGKPFSTVTLESYEIRFEADEAIPTVTGSLGWTVGSGQTVTGSIVVVPAALKVEPPLISLRNGGEILTTARLTISGHEATSGSAVKVEVTFPVNFANWADQN